jgi:hypothetical protein
MATLLIGRPLRDTRRLRADDAPKLTACGCFYEVMEGEEQQILESTTRQTPGDRGPMLCISTTGLAEAPRVPH